MNEFPWFRFFPQDWLAGTSDLSAAERGVYITLLAVIYDRGGPIPRNDVSLGRRCGLPKAGFVRALESLIEAGKLTLNDGMISNERAEIELVERAKHSATQAKRAQSRWQKNKEKQQSENTAALPETCLSQSQSQSHNTKIVDHTDRLVVASPSAPRKASRAKPRTQIAEDAQPSEKDRAAAAEAGLSAEQFRTEWRRFRDHHRAKGSLMADWSAAWRTWLGNIAEFQRQPRASPGYSHPKGMDKIVEYIKTGKVTQNEYVGAEKGYAGEVLSLFPQPVDPAAGEACWDDGELHGDFAHDHASRFG